MSKVFLLGNVGIGPSGPDDSGKSEPSFPLPFPHKPNQKPYKEGLEVWL